MGNHCRFKIPVCILRPLIQLNLSTHYGFHDANSFIHAIVMESPTPAVDYNQRCVVKSRFSTLFSFYLIR